MTRCAYCGREFAPRTVTQKYCSRNCRVKASYHGLVQRESVTFQCAKCGRTVVTEGNRDMRTRFCCAECEKKYWRHPPYEREAARQNFRSAAEYASHERRTNEREEGRT